MDALKVSTLTISYPHCAITELSSLESNLMVPPTIVVVENNDGKKFTFTLIHEEVDRECETLCWHYEHVKKYRNGTHQTFVLRVYND